MSNIQGLRTLIQNGWTRNTIKLFEQKLGKEQFEILKQAYSKMQNEIPIIPKAATKGEDIYLSFSMPLESGNFFDLSVFSDLPSRFRGRFFSGTQKFIDSLFPKFKNEEINLEHIGEKFSNSDMDEKVTQDAIFKAIGLNFKKESYKISDLVRLKHVGNTATLKRDASFTSEVVLDKKGFWSTVGKLFGVSEKEYIGAEQFYRNATHYNIKHNGKTIGYFSIDNTGELLEIGNYVLYPEYRNTKASMNAILTVRDRVIEQAEQTGIKTIKAGAAADNTRLLGLYQRFGFQPSEREIWSFTDDAGNVVTEDTYNLIGYLA